MNKTTLKKIKDVFARMRDRDTGKMVASPYRDWALVVALFLITALFLVVIGFYFFVRIKSGDIAASGVEREARSAIDRAALDAVIELNTKKKEFTKKLLETPPSFVDPSR